MLLFFVPLAPATPPPEPPIELSLMKEALPGKEIEIVAVDENNQEYLPFVLKPELPNVTVVTTTVEEKKKRVFKPARKAPVKSKKTFGTPYKRRGTRNK